VRRWTVKQWSADAAHAGRKWIVQTDVSLEGGEAHRLQNTHPAVLKVLDAWTGKELYNSGAAMTSWVHFSGLAVSNGKVFAVDHDSNVYCFGLAAAAREPLSSAGREVEGEQPAHRVGVDSVTGGHGAVP
jgi:hypothetical protein